VDILEHKAGSASRISFLLHPEVEVDRDGSALLLRRGDGEARMTCSLPLELLASVWWPDMGVEVPTRRIVADLPPGELVAKTTLDIRRRPTAGIHR
jgi:hypothetical protein